MSMKTKLFGIAIVLLMAYSCSDISTEQRTDVSFVDDNFISLEQALDYAEQMFDVIGASSTDTKSSAGRRISDVKCLYETKTKSDDESLSKTLYLVNYADEKGFALLSSDRRALPIYAISDSGNFEISDTVSNKGLAAFMRIVNADLALTDIYEQRKPATKLSTPVASDFGSYKIILGAQTYPLILKVPSRWSQKSPYNKYCFTASGDTALVGCAAVAIGMIMSYYSWPSSIDGQRLNWNLIKQSASANQTAKFLAYLGGENLLNMNYGVDRSSAVYQNYSRTFTGMGYKEPNPLKSFSESGVRDALNDALKGITNNSGNGPVLARSYAANSLGGHAWVIDGYAQYITDTSTNPIDSTATLFHCVWGWNGKSNGYFYFGSDKKFSGSQIAISPDDEEDIHNIWYVFNSVQYMSNFKKNQ